MGITLIACLPLPPAATTFVDSGVPHIAGSIRQGSFLTEQQYLGIHQALVNVDG
jgi:hypothetical protein